MKVDLGSVDDAARGVVVDVRDNIPARAMHAVRARLIDGDERTVRNVIAFVLGVDDEKVDAALAEWPESTRLKVWVWRMENGLFRRPAILDILESRTYEQYHGAQGLLK